MKKKEEIILFAEEHIKSGKWKPGQKILSESQFMDIFHISRGTARGAITELEKKGLIETKKGKGSFVKETELNPQGEKEYILIATQEHTITGEIKRDFRYLLMLLQENISKRGYKPIVQINTDIENTSISNIIDKTAGIISLYATETDLKIYDGRNIPIVEVFHSTATPLPTIILDYLNYFYIIKDLKEKYNKILIINIKQDFERKYYGFWDIFTHYAIEQYLLNSDKYDYRPIPISKDKTVKTKYVKNILENLDYIPDCVVIQDDIIFSAACPLFEEYDHIFSKAKIIAHFPENMNYTGKYPLTKIDFSISEIARKATDLLIKMINKEYIKKYNIYVKPTVKKED